MIFSLFRLFRLFRKKTEATEPTLEQLPIYYVPDWMEQVIEQLIKADLASLLTKSKTSTWKNYRRFEVERIHKIETGREGTTRLEYSTEKSMVVWNEPYHEKFRDFAKRHLWQKESGQELIEMAVDYARERKGRYELSVYRSIVQLLITEGLERLMKSGSEANVVLKGDFSLIGRLPLGAKLEVHGNVDAIEGSTGSFLKIVGDVKNLGWGPFWSISPVGGDETGRLEIHGDVKGYMSSIDNPNLDIEIFGSVTTEEQFLYVTHFHKMTIHKNVYTKTPFEGLFQGDVIVLGKIIEREWLERAKWEKTSASQSGRCNIWCKGEQLVKDGNIPGVPINYT